MDLNTIRKHLGVAGDACTCWFLLLTYMYPVHCSIDILLHFALLGYTIRVKTLVQPAISKFS